MFKNFIFSFTGIFVAMDIIGILPIYLGMSQGASPKERRRVVDMSIIVAAVVAYSFILIGRTIFKLMGIAIWDFKVGGGIVLLVMAILDLIRSKSHDDQHSTSTGVVPLAVPLITGPALITTVMLQVSLYGTATVVLAAFANFLFTWMALRNSNRITRWIGKEGTDISSKIAALFMTAIGFSMIRSGLFEAFSAYGK